MFFAVKLLIYFIDIRTVCCSDLAGNSLRMNTYLNLYLSWIFRERDFMGLTLLVYDKLLKNLLHF